MHPPLLSRRLMPLALLVACGLATAVVQPASAHPDHHQPTQQGDRRGNATDQHQHNQHQHNHQHH